MEIQNELKKIAVSEEQVRKMIEVYNKNDKVSSRVETNINAVEQIVMDPVIENPVVNDVLDVSAPVNNGSTNIFDEVSSPSVNEPVVDPVVTPEVVVSDVNLFDTPSNDVVMDNSNIESEIAPVLPVKEEKPSEDILSSDKEILDKLYDLELHIRQFAVELEEYLNNKKNVKENLNNINNFKENNVEEKIVPSVSESVAPSYDESINIFDAPSSFKL